MDALISARALVDDLKRFNGSFSGNMSKHSIWTEEFPDFQSKFPAIAKLRDIKMTMDVEAEIQATRARLAYLEKHWSMDADKTKFPLIAQLKIIRVQKVAEQEFQKASARLAELEQELQAMFNPQTSTTTTECKTCGLKTKQ